MSKDRKNLCQHTRHRNPSYFVFFSGAAGPFEINPSTGYLSSNAAIVYLDASSYSLTVTATDSGGRIATAIVAITIIEGELARKPVFELPISEDYDQHVYL